MSASWRIDFCLLSFDLRFIRGSRDFRQKADPPANVKHFSRIRIYFGLLVQIKTLAAPRDLANVVQAELI